MLLFCNFLFVVDVDICYSGLHCGFQHSVILLCPILTDFDIRYLSVVGLFYFFSLCCSCGHLIWFIILLDIKFIQICFLICSYVFKLTSDTIKRFKKKTLLEMLRIEVGVFFQNVKALKVQGFT